MKRIPTFLAGMLTAAVIGGLGVGALAASGQLTISVDPVNIQVNGETFQPKDANGKDVPVFAYQGTTYAPLRALAEAYGLEVGYDSEFKAASVNGVSAAVSIGTAKYNGVQTTIEIAEINEEKYISLPDLKAAFGLDINSNSDNIYSAPDMANIAATVVEDSNGNEIKSMYPANFSSDNFFIWNYMTIVFNKDIKSINSADIVIVDLETGSHLRAKAQPGNTAKDNLIISPMPVVGLGHTYSLFIPANTVKMIDGTSFGEDIRLIFKMTDTAVKGTVTGDDQFGQQIILRNSSGEDYSAIIRGANEFSMVSVPGGNYDIIFSGEVQGTVTVQEGKVNTIKVNLK